MVLPDFLIKPVPKQENIRKIRTILNDESLHTVCESASCPNIGECFSKQTLTFLILGNICTRHCKFCGVQKGTPLPPDLLEPNKIAKAAKKLGLNYVVITSVTRDDLPDGGASQFAETIRTLRPISVEVLVPDFNGNEIALQTVLDAAPFVLNHNVETVPRLYSEIRPQANYERSLKLLENSKNQGICTKSGFMVGLGETEEEIISVLVDIKKTGCDIVTIGQYLAPSRNHLPAKRHVDPKEFEEYQRIGQRLGFREIVCGPFVRSSYQAAEILCRKHSDY